MIGDLSMGDNKLDNRIEYIIITMNDQILSMVWWIFSEFKN